MLIDIEGFILEDMLITNMPSYESNDSRNIKRLVSILSILFTSLILYFYLYSYSIGFINGEFTLSLFEDQFLVALENLLLINLSFVAFSVIIKSMIGLFLPDISLSDDNIDKLMNMTYPISILVIGIIAPIEEELEYRLLPYILISVIFFLFGSSGIWYWIAVVIVVIDTVDWVISHGKRTPVIIPHGIFYGVLLWNGLLIEALIVHIVYNSSIVTLNKIYPN